MIVVDKSKLKLEYRNLDAYVKGMEEFLQKVAMLKPLVKFEVTEKDLRHSRKAGPNPADGLMVDAAEIERVRLYQNGEHLGNIRITYRYRDGAKEDVYEVESFRISKQRGNNEATQTKHLRIALATVKKVFQAREDNELKELITKEIKASLKNFKDTCSAHVRWDFSVDDEIAFYAMEAWQARGRGAATTELPSKPSSIKDITEHDKKCERYFNVKKLYDMMLAKQGYGTLQNTDKSITVYSFYSDHVLRYNSYDDLPENIAEKYAVFKILGTHEPVVNIGCKFHNDYAFVAG